MIGSAILDLCFPQSKILPTNYCTSKFLDEAHELKIADCRLQNLD